MLSSFEKTEDGEYVYPDEYAGAYLKDNTLCINLTDMSEDMLEKYRILCGDSCRIDFNLVDHSYAELLEAYEIISTSEVDNLTSVSVDIKENQIDVGIADEVNANANTSVQNSLNVISLNEDLGNIPVSVTHEDYWTVATETLKGGTHGSVDAILLCGHNLARGSQIVLAEDGADAIVLGSVVRHQFADGEKYDYAVAELYSTADVELTNLVKNNASTTGTTITSCATTDDLLLNTTVCKYGKMVGLLWELFPV